MKSFVLALCVLLLAVQYLSAEIVPESGDDVEVDMGNGPNPPTKEEIQGALKKADQMMKDALKKVEEEQRSVKTKRRALGWRVRVSYDKK